MGSSWSVEQAPSLTGKVAIVTGANSGLGLVTALEIARLGAHVIVAARNEESSRKAVADIQKQTGNKQVEFMKLDLASLRSVKAFADAFRAKGLSLHILVNNAGVMATPRTLTEDGNEMQFQTNHLGHFLLTVLLEDILERSAPARVVNVSSGMHWSPYSGGVRFDDLTGEQYYRPWWAYGQSKLCNVLFTHELARRLADKQIFVNATHPGYAATNLQSGSWFLTNILNPLFGSSPEKGARSQLFAAVAPEVERNNIRAEYIGPPAAIQRQSAYAKNVDLQKRLWEVSRELVRPFLSESALQFAS